MVRKMDGIAATDGIALVIEVIQRIEERFMSAP
jgi:hypothetical protein